VRGRSRTRAARDGQNVSMVSGWRCRPTVRCIGRRPLRRASGEFRHPEVDHELVPLRRLHDLRFRSRYGGSGLGQRSDLNDALRCACLRLCVRCDGSRQHGAELLTRQEATLGCTW